MGEVWKRPEYYFGFNPEGDYYVYSMHRDSDALGRSNYRAAKDSMEEVQEKLYEQGYEEAVVPEDERPSGRMSWVYTFQASHWAVGWVEYLMLRWDAPDALREEMNSIDDALFDYPVLDEEDFSREEDEEAQSTWEFYGLRDKIELCVEAGLSMFAARTEHYPSDDQGFIQGRLLGR